MIKFSILSSLFLMLACNGTKDTSTTNEMAKMDVQQEMMEQGFTKGTIVYSDIEGDCEYTIKLEDGRMFESTDLKEEFKKADMEVWFKFQPLRRMNKCKKANPVGISEMKMVQ